MDRIVTSANWMLRTATRPEIFLCHDFNLEHGEEVDAARKIREIDDARIRIMDDAYTARKLTVGALTWGPMLGMTPPHGDFFLLTEARMRKLQMPTAFCALLPGRRLGVLHG